MYDFISLKLNFLIYTYILIYLLLYSTLGLYFHWLPTSFSQHNVLILMNLNFIAIYLQLHNSLPLYSHKCMTSFSYIYNFTICYDFILINVSLYSDKSMRIKFKFMTKLFSQNYNFIVTKLNFILIYLQLYDSLGLYSQKTWTLFLYIYDFMTH